MAVSRYCLIGPTPPPLGGVSVHIARLTKKLRADGKAVVNVDVAGARGLKKAALILRIVLDPRPAEFQLHAYDFSAAAALIMRPFPKRIVYMDHGTPLYQRELTGLRRFLFARILRKADHLAFVSEEGREYYQKAGYELAPTVSIQSAFLPPPVGEENAILATYPQEVREFIETRRPLLTANASQLLHYDGIDLYGLDMCVELIARLKRQFPDVGMLFAIGNADTNAEYLQQVRDQIAEKGIAKNFQFLTGQREVWPVFRHADLMVRPTSNDGYAISLEEAIFCGTRTLASDAAVRPPQTKTFRSRDADDFERKSLELLKDGTQS